VNSAQYQQLVETRQERRRLKPAPDDRLYVGVRSVEEGAVLLYIDDRDLPGRKLPLLPSLRLVNHSPTGFEWGYAGSGPAQTALALLLDATGDPDVARGRHQQFKFEVVANFGREEWKLSANSVRKWVNTGAL